MRVFFLFSAEFPRAIVSFPYEAANSDELSLAEGDIITVLNQDIADAGWWKGELKGRVGVFPDNFVKLLPSDDVSRAVATFLGISGIVGKFCRGRETVGKYAHSW